MVWGSAGDVFPYVRERLLGLRHVEVMPTREDMETDLAAIMGLAGCRTWPGWRVWPKGVASAGEWGDNDGAKVRVSLAGLPEVQHLNVLLTYR